MKVLLLLWVVSVFPAQAEKMESHRQEVTALMIDLDKNEKRMNELLILKDKTSEGSDLETIVNEITDIQKKLLGLKQRKSIVTEHLHLAHPNDDLLSEMALKRDHSQKSASKTKLKLPGKDDAIDDRLNRLLTQIQSQYARTAKDREELVKKSASGAAMVITVGDKKKSKREILQDDKDKYLKDTLKTKMKISSPAPVQSGPVEQH